MSLKEAVAPSNRARHGCSVGALDTADGALVRHTLSCPRKRRDVDDMLTLAGVGELAVHVEEFLVGRVFTVWHCLTVWC